MRIAIVNDMPLAVEALRRVVLTAKQYEIAWIAADGAEAVRKCAADRPDLVLMDLIMPVMDGAEATKQIMIHSPCAILVVTATVSGNAGKVFDAMGHGALDAVNTPVLGRGPDIEGASSLLIKIENIAKLIGKHTGRKLSGVTTQKPTSSDRMVAIAASTGGPLVVLKILRMLPKPLPFPMVIIQHVDAEFAPGLAEWLSNEGSVHVELVHPGDEIHGGRILLAGTNDHLIYAGPEGLQYTSDPKDFPYRPSADVFFRSLVENWRGTGTAVLLTGMGKDGAEGLLMLRNNGWVTVAQDQATSIVFGMPKAAAEIGAAQLILPEDQIANAITQWTMQV